MNKIFSPFSKRGLSLKNRLVMAPMTRSRAINNLPNELMAQYYAQRAGAGLIITEGTAPSPAGLGYPRIPGIFSEEQVQGWKLVTNQVHAAGSKIFVQLMHTGRIGHQYNLPDGAELVGPSTLKAAGQIFTDQAGMQDHSEPVALSEEGIQEVVQEHVKAARNAISAGFEGIELHGANGYLIEQFLNPGVNTRTDQYGGNIAGRARLAIELATEIAGAIGKEKVGIRFSPFSTLGDLPVYDEVEVHETYVCLAEQLEKIGVAYLHIGVTAAIPESTLNAIRQSFTGTIILCNGFTPETAQTTLDKGSADLVAFGRSFLANPDLAARIETGAALNEVDFATLYTPGAEGYTDYPALSDTTRSDK
ncbi:alkene reductase [Dyadobacter crusticola]|uniref:alkene reductase n=1 Tax=Dyadobacter crusticola TaxID=292407 RepID=UPI0004E1AACA|nr:alkene reductase [Dyadobacter crusticola]